MARHMKIRKIYIAIGLVGVLTTSFLCASSAMSSDQLPSTHEKNQLLSQEEMAHKMMLFKEAFPKAGTDIVRGDIGPTLHAASVKTFTCPTIEELQHVVPKETGERLFDKWEIMEFEENGIYYTTTGLPPANAKLDLIAVTFKGQGNNITTIACRYGDNPVNVNFKKSPLKESLVTLSQNDVKFGTVKEWMGNKVLTFNKNIEFTMQPINQEIK
jgi:hypothetical protein